MKVKRQDLSSQGRLYSQLSPEEMHLWWTST